MSAYPAWTPAPRPGIIPLHPLTFGTILGRSFSALRGNPRVLLGFALGVQAIAYVLLIAGIGGIGWLTFSRLDTAVLGSDEYDAIVAGSTLITALAGFALGLLATALGVIVQGVVVVEVAHAVVAERLTLKALWHQVKPVAWRLIGYSLLVLLVVVAVVAVVTAAIVALGALANPALAIALTVMTILASIPLYLWLSIKLLLVPSAIILEGATITQAVGRSWTLIRGRFWAALGVIVVISLIFGTISQFASIPFTFVSAGLTTVFAPTGDPNASGIIALVVTLGLTYILVLLIQAVTIVVQATASALIYIDCRMRHEGLDIDLLGYVERRDSGATALDDPWTAGIGRAITPRQTAPYAPPPGYPAAAGYPGAPAQPGQPLYPPAPGYPPGQAYPGYASAPPYAAAPAYPTAPPYAAAPAQAAPPPAPPAPAPVADAPQPTRWTAPGASDSPDPDSPWA